VAFFFCGSIKGVYILHTMIRTNHHLTQKQITALRKLAKRLGVSVSELIRQAVDAFLKGTT